MAVQAEGSLLYWNIEKYYRI